MKTNIDLTVVIPVHSVADPNFNELMRAVFAGEDACKNNLQKHNILFAILFSIFN